MLRIGNNPSVVRYRTIITLLFIFMIYQWRCYTNELKRLQQNYESEINMCRDNAESIMAKIEVVYNHKVKLERVLRSINVNKTEVTGIKSSLQKCLLENGLTKSRLRQCEVDLSELNSTHVELQENTVVDQNKEQTQPKNIQELESKLKQSEQRILEQDNETRLLKERLENCEKTMVQYVGAVPVAHYTHNDTSFFQRKHKINEALSFDRDAIEVHQPANLIRGAELARKLQEKNNEMKKEINVHPEDRREEDEYVQQIQNKEEQDYKEGP